jgi:error-prone DNA polymerase
VSEPGLSAQATLETLTWEGAERRFPGGVPEQVRGQLRHELALSRRWITPRTSSP